MRNPRDLRAWPDGLVLTPQLDPDLHNKLAAGLRWPLNDALGFVYVLNENVDTLLRQLEEL